MADISLSYASQDLERVVCLVLGVRGTRRVGVTRGFPTNWEAIGASAEALAALVVIVTLIFLAIPAQQVSIHGRTALPAHR